MNKCHGGTTQPSREPDGALAQRPELTLHDLIRLTLDPIQNRGTIGHARVHPRAMVRRALERSAKSMIIVHNHLIGDPTPSRPDIHMTRQIVEAARALDLSVHDHLIVGRDGVASFKQLGLM
jgi:DNA repair protein RadC